ncbi:GntR family transcriptional regulator [bacterium 210820-DFI.6.52]|nr:GntR family transcriptional regulator [bacterium 210820-DFI.6.52]
MPSQPPVDKSAPIPLYYQVACDLKSRIQQGEWKPNEKIPSEHQLTEYYGVSRISLRQALAELEKDGILLKKRGKGTFLTDRPTPDLQPMKYMLTSSLRFKNQRERMEVEVLDSGLRDAGFFPNLPQEFGLQGRVVYYKRLFFSGGVPLALARSWIPAALVPGMEEKPLPRGRIVRLLEGEYGLSPYRVADSLEIIRPTHTDAQDLQITRDSPLIFVKGVSYLKGETPLEYSSTLWVADRVRFQMENRAEWMEG